MIQQLIGKNNVYDSDNKLQQQFRTEQKQEEEVVLPTNKVLVFDGQIDSFWIDYLNVIETNNKVLYLENSNSVNLEDFKIILETTNLREANPTFVRINW